MATASRFHGSPRLVGLADHIAIIVVIVIMLTIIVMIMISIIIVIMIRMIIIVMKI